MNELTRIAARGVTGRNLRATVSAYGSAGRYDVTTAAGVVYRNVYSPWQLYAGDGVWLAVDRKKHSAEIVGYADSPATTIKKVIV